MKANYLLEFFVLENERWERKYCGYYNESAKRHEIHALKRAGYVYCRIRHAYVKETDNFEFAVVVHKYFLNEK